MAKTSLDELITAAALADGPGFPPATVPKPGGVDPLGLRQINFDLMDKVLPGLNNVARHVRPFVVVSWAWRRAGQLAKRRGSKDIPVETLRDFVDRIEVIYVWSQLMRNPDADLPGVQFLAPLMQADQWTFGGSAWQQLRNTRRYSTSLSAPINYGPGLKMLGWINPHRDKPNIFIPSKAAEPALDAFEKQIADRLDHQAFSSFGSVKVKAEEARDWAETWALHNITPVEAGTMAKLLFGSEAPTERQLGGELIMAAAGYVSSIQIDILRRAMAGPPSTFNLPDHLKNISDAWRHLQIRQLFRLALEALLHWIIINLEDKSRSTKSLIELFISQDPNLFAGATTRDCLTTVRPRDIGPVQLIEKIEAALKATPITDLIPSITAALALCLSENLNEEAKFERSDRLSMYRAQREANAMQGSRIEEFIRHVLEAWVLAQHVYWSVGRGLADARSQGKTLLRLKVVIEEGGWTLVPGALRGRPPEPTPDRLQTAVNLAKECGLL